MVVDDVTVMQAGLLARSTSFGKRRNMCRL
jgi:hypothetical protein